MRLPFAVVVVTALLAGIPVSAQTLPGLVLSPTALEFAPSPDHHATTLSGAPILTEYRALYFVGEPSPSATPAITVPLGKPQPDSQGTLRALNIFGQLLPDTIYKAVVVAVGPAGVGPFSSASNPFGVEAPPRVPAAPPGPVIIR